MKTESQLRYHIKRVQRSGAIRKALYNGGIQIEQLGKKQKPKNLKMCERCGILTSHMKYCSPCSDDVVQERKKQTYSKPFWEWKKF